MHRTSDKYASRLDGFFKIIAFAIIFLGIAVRLAVFFQNRNLFIDEANIARNIYERNIFELATPLSYEQYAPPVFLWMLELFTFLFGYGEMAFRIYPLLSSVGSIILLYFILKEITSLKSLWYPLGLFVVGYMSIRYATELKQYISDVLVVLSLIWLALKTDIFTTTKRRFIITWFVAGSIGIWAAMPSVFALAGVGAYYFWQILLKKDFKKTWIIITVAVLWLAQFALYYFLILKPQIDSSYLQNFHQDYFLFATPTGKDEWMHNWKVIKNLIQEAGGFDLYTFNFNLSLLILGIVFFLIRNTAKGLLFFVPLLAVIIAAALNQYSLIPRVAFFITPLILVFICYGFYTIIKIREKIFCWILLPFGLYFIYTFSSIKMAWENYETEQITDALNFVMQQQINHGNQLYIHNGARPAFIYYSQIHPAQGRWHRIKDAHLLSWDANYDTLASASDTLTGYIFTSIDPNELAAKRAIIEKHNNEVAQLEKRGCYAYIYRKN